MRTRAIAILIMLAVLAIPVAGFLWMTSVPGVSADGSRMAQPSPAVLASAELLERDVTAIASEPHNLAFPRALERSALYIEEQLEAAGYRVTRQKFEVDGKPARNIEVVVDPADPMAETLVIGAHYDSAGGAPGANDNGSGSAVLLMLARRLAELDGKAKLRLRLVFFVNEEPPYFKTGHMGSLVYARALSRRDETIRGMISLETLGYYRDGDGTQAYPFPLGLLYPDKANFVSFVALLSSRGFMRETVRDFRKVAAIPSEGGSAPGWIQGIDWSDHWSFEQHGIPALMVTDTAPFRYPHYHRASDTPDKIDFVRLAFVEQGLEDMLRDWAE